MMRTGERVSVFNPVNGEDLAEFFKRYGKDREVYARQEDAGIALYLVTREGGGRGSVYASTLVPQLPEKV